MDRSTNSTSHAAWTTRERPWLVPWNRRLRHLQSICIRNLDFASSQRSRGRTNDDNVLPGAFQSPAKQLALREANILGHSKSSDNLRPIQELHDGTIQDADLTANATAKALKDKKLRPTKRLRRRSTLDWSSASSQARQQNIEALSAARLADVFFSLHAKGVAGPLYVSEVIERTMNPDFGRIDFEGCGEWVRREGSVVVKVWVRTSTSQKYYLLLEMSLDLRSLQFLGKELATFNHPFPPNTVIFRLSGGYYTCFTDAPVSEPIDPFAAISRQRPASPRQERTSSFDALLRLSKLDDSVQDALSFRDKLVASLHSMVGRDREVLQDESRVEESKDFLKTINYAKSTMEKQLKSLKQLRDRKTAALRRRKDLISNGRIQQSSELSQMTGEQSDMAETRDNISTISRAILNQRRRISSDLGRIFPFHPLKDKPLSFSIRHLHLPDSEDLEETTPDTVAAALGYSVHVLQLAAFYLDQALPYTVQPRSSTSTITDPVSDLKADSKMANSASMAQAAHHAATEDYQNARHVSVPYMPPSLTDPARTFPLFPKSSGPKFRFEYGLFLLNKAIQTLLSNAYGVRVLDIRQTLPNLMYIIACMGAGEGELPARQAGGVRGLARIGMNRKGAGSHDGEHRSEGENRITVKREWQVGREERKHELRTSFKPGGLKARPTKHSYDSGNATIDGADWEGMLKGDLASIKRGAAIANGRGK